jgi:N-acetylneuraminate synthase/pseudaminic acid synthase
MKIGNIEIGVGQPTFVIAEMSGNHGGSLERAIQIIHAIKRSGANAVKLQTYTAETITLNCMTSDFLLPSDSKWSSYENLHELYDAAHTPWEWHARLFEEARAINLEIFSSPFDETAVDFLETLNVSAYKIASPEINHIPLLKKVASTRKPVIISTGLAELEDIDLALETLKQFGAGEVAVLKCTTEYPASPENLNLYNIAFLRERYGVPVGLSDHSVGNFAPTLAVAAGASILEKHFTLSDSVETVDSFFSLGEDEFTQLVKEVRLTEIMLGSRRYKIPDFSYAELSSRRSLYASKSIKKGETFTSENVKCVRPGHGLSPKYYDELLGLRANRDIEFGQRIDSSDLIEAFNAD